MVNWTGCYEHGQVDSVVLLGQFDCVGWRVISFGQVDKASWYMGMKCRVRIDLHNHTLVQSI